VRRVLYEGIGAVAIDPRSPSTVYAGTHYSGPWPSAGPPPLFGKALKSTNGGITWFEVGEGLPGPYFAALVIDPRVPSRIYAATSNGVFRSENGGGNWTALNDGFPEYTFVHSVAFDPGSADTLYAGTDKSVFKITLSETSLGVPEAIPTLDAKWLTALGVLLATLGLLMLRR
jgi:photosystem II stability/assembly factor-like uncharacterized protein